MNRTNYKAPEWTAAIAALLFGMIAHSFGLVNILHNMDDIGQQPYGYGTGIHSGRWLLSVLGDIFGKLGGNYNLSVVNGILFLLLIAAASALVVSVFRIRSRISAGLIGMLFSVFPSVTTTMFFRYTVVYYGISLVLAILAAWLLEKRKRAMLLSSLCIAFSLGIYQAYVPFTISIFVILLLQRALEGKTGLAQLVRRGLSYCVTLIVGLLLYFLLLKVFLMLYNTQLSDYNGVNHMGKLALSEIPALLKEAVYTFCMLPLKNYCGLANMVGIRAVYIILGGLTIIFVCYRLLFEIRKMSIAVFTCLMGLLFPVAVNFIVIMCPDGWIYTLMLYPFVMIGCVPLVLMECLHADVIAGLKRTVLEKAAAILVAILIFSYAYDANINYTSLYYANRQTENYLNAMVVQVRMTEGFNVEQEWAFIGKIEDPLLVNPWQYETYYGMNEPAWVLINRDTRYSWFQTYFGYTIPFADDERVAELCELEEVKQMPCWPNAGSIKIVDDTVVIKCQDLFMEETK